MEWILVIGGGMLLGILVREVIKGANLPQSVVNSDKKIVLFEWEAKDANDTEKYNFRKTRWGMSFDEVINSEQEHGEVFDYEDKTNVVYNVLIETRPAVLIYTLEKGQLVDAGYSFKTLYSDYNMYMLDFENIVSKICEKYGEPNSNIWNWENHEYESNSDMYGLAVSLGHLSRYCKWITQRTNVTATHAVRNGERIMHVAYSEISYAEKEAKKILEDTGNYF